MNRSMLWYFFIFLFLNFHNYAMVNQLQKVFCHQAPDQISIEIGKIVLYFLSEPTITQISNNGKNNLQKNKIVFFIPQTQIASHECQEMIRKCNRSKNSLYTMTIRQVSRPAMGIEMSIIYNPQLVAFKYDAFESIGKQSGLVFTFLNKKIIDQLKEHQDSVLSLASHTPPTIIIDAGHGGSDIGAKGFFGIKEKDLTKKIGDTLADYLRAKGWHILLTRAGDEFVALDKRTALANKCGADIMISLHANYSSNPKASGIETFCLDASLFKPLYFSSGSINSFRNPMSDNLIKLSNLLASKVHNEIIQMAQKNRGNDTVINRKIKHSVSQVLLGSSIPTILIELGFISNQQDAFWLNKNDYQYALVEGIYAGIKKYFNAKG